MPKIVDWYMEKKINIDDLITHTMPLEKINDAFTLMHEGKSIRSVVLYLKQCADEIHRLSCFSDVACRLGGLLAVPQESPQQQYTEALMRGNSMQASQIWLHMSPEDRDEVCAWRGHHARTDQRLKK